MARHYAKKGGYDPALLEFSDKKEYKLMYDNKHYFGHPSYNDFLIYTILAKIKHSPKYTTAYSLMKRKSYLARSGAIQGDWEEDKFSANNLARQILWALKK